MTETSATVAVIEQAAPKELARDRQFSRLKQHARLEVFTKFANVKSRISWTADRRQKLQEMWERGDKAPVIAAALGCKVGAVNVARARFGLKPRRIVSGRPKQEADEPGHKIKRVAFTTSRLMEFCTEKELVAQTGHEVLRVVARRHQRAGRQCHRRCRGSRRQTGHQSQYHNRRVREVDTYRRRR